MRSLEERILDIVHQEIAFPYADIIHDQSTRFMFKEELDEGLESWITGRLASIESITEATQLFLDIVKEPKREEVEVEQLPQHGVSCFARAFASAYVTHAVAARYELCLGLITLLFFLSDDLHQWDPVLLSQTLVFFRGLAMLKYVTEQPGGDEVTSSSAAVIGNNGSSIEADEMLMRLRNLNVSRNGSLSTSEPSLLYRLISNANTSGDGTPLPASAHYYLDSTGLLFSYSLATATRQEVAWCNRLREIGCYVTAREMLEWLPRTPGVMYVWARLWLDTGRDVDAVSAFDSLAGSFGAFLLPFRKHAGLMSLQY